MRLLTTEIFGPTIFVPKVSSNLKSSFMIFLLLILPRVAVPYNPGVLVAGLEDYLILLLDPTVSFNLLELL